MYDQVPLDLWDSETDLELEQWLQDLSNPSVEIELFKSIVTEIQQQPRYLFARPPSLSIAPAQEGSTFPGDIPCIGQRMSDFCWIDMCGNVHFNLPYANEEAYPHHYNTFAVGILVPDNHTQKTNEILQYASFNRLNRMVILHGYNLETGELNVIGRYLMMTTIEELSRPCIKGLSLTFMHMMTTNRIVKISTLEMMLFHEKIEVQHKFCCVGCYEGIGCFKTPIKRKYKRRLVHE